jgi:predicted NBD/HSP70 family sugar kinase
VVGGSGDDGNVESFASTDADEPHAKRGKKSHVTDIFAAFRNSSSADAAPEELLMQKVSK